MAEKKAETTAIKDPVLEAIEASKKPVEIYIPRASENESKEFVVAVNGKEWSSFPRGRKSTVPMYIAEEVRRTLHAQDAYEDTVNELLDKAK